LFETSLESVAPISYSKKIDAAIEQGLLNDYKMFIVYHELEDKTPIYLHKYKETTYYKTERQQHDYLLRKYQQCSNKNGFPFELVNLKLFFKNLSSKEKLAKLFLSTSLKDKKTLIYAGSIKQTKNFDIPPYHSELPKKERENNFNNFCDSKFLHLIDVNGIKESVNIQNLTHVLMMAPDASQNLFLQSLGRALRLIIGDVAQFIILCAKNSQEETWLNKASATIPPDKITKLNYNSHTNTITTA